VLAAKDPEVRRQIGRYGQYVRWAGVPDRQAETAPARAAGTGTIDYWVKRLDPERFANATDQQKLDAADMLLRAHFLKMSMASAKARRKKAS
jgi:hypothetical protein